MLFRSDALRARLQIGGIVELMLDALRARLQDKQLALEITEAAKDAIIEGGYDPVFGARPLKRYIQHHVETLIARRIIRDDHAPGSTIRIDAGADGLTAEIL